MTNIINLDDHRKKDDDLNNVLYEMAIEVHKEIVDMHEQSVLNYEQHKVLLQRLNDILNRKGSKK